MAGGSDMKVTGSNPIQYAQPTGGKEKLPMKDALQAMFPHMSFSDVQEPKAKTVKPHNTPEGNHKTTQREGKVSFSLKGLKEAIGKLIDKIVSLFTSSSKGNKGKVDGGKSDTQPQITAPKTEVKSETKVDTTPTKSSDVVVSKETPETGKVTGSEQGSKGVDTKPTTKTVLTVEQMRDSEFAKLRLGSGSTFLRTDNIFTKHMISLFKPGFNEETVKQISFGCAVGVKGRSKIDMTEDPQMTHLRMPNKNVPSVLQLASNQLNQWLDPKGVLLTSIPQELKTELASVANMIKTDPNLTKEQANHGIKTLYSSVVFLRGVNPLVTVHMSTVAKSPENTDIRFATAISMSVLNEAKEGKHHPLVEPEIGKLKEIYNKNFETAMKSIGMPELRT